MTITVNETEPNATERIAPLLEPLLKLMCHKPVDLLVPVVAAYINILAANGLVPACSVTKTHESLSVSSLAFLYDFTLGLDWADGTKGEIRVGT